MNKAYYLLNMVAFMLLLSVASCKTTEENYKAAYDIAVKKQESGAGKEVSTIISQEKRKREYQLIGNDSIRVKTEYISIIDGPVNNVEKYGIVVGEFKQVFNARSYRNRINNIENDSVNPAFVVMNRMKQYYVIYRSFESKNAAAAFMKNESNFKVRNKAKETWILEMLGRK